MKTPPFRKGPTALLLALLAASGAGLAALKGATDRVVRSQVPGSSIIYVPSGKFLRFATFGCRSLAADLLYLWAIQYYSTPTIATAAATPPSRRTSSARPSPSSTAARPTIPTSGSTPSTPATSP